jgi:hypothetical protein
MVPYPEENLLLRLLGGAAPAVVEADQVDPARFVDLCRRHGVAGLVREARPAGGSAWPPAIDAGLEQATRKTLVDNLALLRALREVAAALEEAGVEFILLKGACLLAFLYPGIEQRPMADLDLLIREEAWPRASSVLESRGCLMPTPESEKDLGEDWYNHLVQVPGTPPCSLEIHWNLESIERSRIDPGALFRHAVPCVLERRPYRRLCDDHLLLHLAVHLAHHLETPSLHWAEDLRRILRRGRLDWDRIEATAVAWGVRNCLAYSLGYLERLFPGAVPEPGRRFRWSPARRLIMDSLGTGNPILPHRDLGRSPLRHAVSMALLDRWSDAARYIARHAAGRALRALGGGRGRAAAE